MAASSVWKTPMCLRWTTVRQVPGRGSQSPQFSFQGQNFSLSLYLIADYYSLFIDSQSSSSKLFNATVQLENRRTGEVLTRLSKINGNINLSKRCIWGCAESDIVEADPEFLADGVFRFLVVLDASDEPKPKTKDDKCIQTPKYMDVGACVDKLSADLAKLLDEGSKPDVEFQCDGEKVKAHKNVLCMRSEVLASMLQSDMKEGRTGIVKLPEENAETFKHFLRYLYTGTLPELTVELAMALYEAADKYSVDPLVKRCGDFLVKNLEPENACEILALLDVHSDKNFQDAVIAFMMAKKIPLKDDLWSEFSEGHPKLANKVLTRFCKLHCDCAE